MIKWHRWNGIEDFEPKVEPGMRVRRPYLYSTPVLKDSLQDYLSYPTSNELGVSIPLYRLGNLLYQNTPAEYAECVIKQSVWLVKHLCEHTDASSMGIPIRLGITTDILDLATKYLRLCDFPMDNVDLLTSREHEMWRATHFDAMRHPSFDNVKRVIHMNTNFLVGSHPDQPQAPLFETILKSWKDEFIACTGYPWAARSDMRFPWWDVIERDKSTGKYQKLADVLAGESEAIAWLQSDPFPYVSGAMFGLTQSSLSDPSFNTELDEMLGVLTDEVAISLYMFKYNPSFAVLEDVIGYGEILTDSDMPRKLWYGSLDMDPHIWLEIHKETE